MILARLKRRKVSEVALSRRTDSVVLLFKHFEVTLQSPGWWGGSIKNTHFKGFWVKIRVCKNMKMSWVCVMLGFHTR